MRSIGIRPIVRRKNNSSIVVVETVFKFGNRRSNFPNRKGWVGCAVLIYLLSITCVWS